MEPARQALLGKEFQRIGATAEKGLLLGTPGHASLTGRTPRRASLPMQQDSIEGDGPSSTLVPNHTGLYFPFENLRDPNNRCLL